MDRSWIYGGLLIAGGIGVARIVGAHPKVREDTRILLFGDSLAKGLSPHIRELATEGSVPYLGAGVVGSRIDQWTNSQWLEDSMDVLDPTLVIAVLGTNDAFSSFSAEEVADHMRILLGTIPLHVDVVWVGAPALPSTYGGRHPNVTILEAIMEEAPYYFPSHDLEIPRGPDGLHPTAAGYAGWAGALWDWLT